jgi:hypothetical protein
MPLISVEVHRSSSETSVDFRRTTWNYNPEDSTLHSHRCANLSPVLFSLAAKMILSILIFSLRLVENSIQN